MSFLIFPLPIEKQAPAWYDSHSEIAARAAADHFWGVRKVNKPEALDRLSRSAEERQLLARVWDKADSARRGAPASTPFLTGSQQEAAARLIAALGHPRHLFSGGYPAAERKVCAFLPEWQEEEDWESPFSALRCSWRSGEKLTHRDFLGAVLGAGIEREKLGDILVGKDSCDLLVFTELVPYLKQNLTEAGRAKLHVEEIPLSQLSLPEKTVKIIHDTVNTPRLDAVFSSGFSLSRGRAAQVIAAGRVEVNHIPCLKGDKLVAQGDVLTCRGLGKCVVTELGGQSKKGRTILTIERYL